MLKIKIKDIATMAQSLINIVDCEGTDYGEEEALNIAHKVIDATTDDYEKDYNKALEAVLQEGMKLYLNSLYGRMVSNDNSNAQGN